MFVAQCAKSEPYPDNDFEIQNSPVGLILNFWLSYVHQRLPEQQSVLSAVSLVSGSRWQVGDAFKLEMWP